jgi:proline iminopeptidase
MIKKSVLLKEIFIKLPNRGNTPETSLNVKLFIRDDEALTDRDVVILIPGGPGNDYSMYDTQENSIARTFFSAANIVLFDPRGCGNSQSSPVEYCSLSHYIDDIEAIRAYFNIPADKLIIFGQSYGSFAALGYAIKYPDNLKKLLLIGAVASSEFMTEAKEELEKIGTDEQKKVAEKIWHGSFKSKQDLAQYCNIMSPLYLYSYTKPEDEPLEVPSTIEILNYGWGQFLKDFDFRPDLHKVKCQTLILWGENEWLMNKNQVYQVHQGIPHSQLIIYPQCSHMLWIDQWDKFVNDALIFLRQPQCL